MSYDVNDLHLSTCWYNVDNGENITLPKCQNTTIGVADEQNHTLYLYANDSVGNLNYSNVTFFVNSSLVPIYNWLVQRGSASVDGTTEVILSTEVPPSKSFILHTQRSSDSGPDSLFVLSNFLNSQKIEFKNYASGGGANVEWEVISSPNLTVSRNIISFETTDTTINIDLPRQFNLSNSFLIITTRLNSGTTTNNQQGRWRGRFFNSTRIQLNRGISGTAGEISWQAVEWKGAEVQSGSFSISSTSGTDTLTNPINLTRSFLIFSSTSDSGTALDYNNIGGFLSNSNTVYFYRQDDDTGNMYADWFVIESPFLYIQRGSFEIDGTTSPIDQSFNPLINLSRSFHRSAWDSTGSGNTHANAIVTTQLTNSSNLRAITGTTASNVKNVSWQIMEIYDINKPIVNLTYPEDNENFSSNYVPFFNFSVREDHIDSCELWGNWSGAWHKDQRIFNPETDTNINFSGVDTGGEGYFIWNVWCNDTYGNTAWANLNRTFAAFYAPWKPEIINITQTSNNGQGNITLYWNSSNHSIKYKIYYTSDLKSSFMYLNETSDLNFTDTTFVGNQRRFYRIDAWNPTGENSSDYFGAHVYSLRHNGDTRNWIGFPANFTYLENANDSLNEITNATAFTMWNATIQKRVTCNTFSCPSGFECTDTNCNFNLQKGRGYEVNINSSAPNEVNWSGVGFVNDAVNINLIKNSTNFGKNWIAMYANTSLSNAQDLIENITNADAVTNWDAQEQTSQGLISSPFSWAPYVGTNFNIEIEKAYEVSVTENETWEQV